jgi:putative chitinase
MEAPAMPLDPLVIAEKLEAPSDNVDTVWPLIVAALQEFGIDSDLVQVAAAATCMVETGRFYPLKELHASQERQPELWAIQERYWPSGFYGRGIVQTTWEDNYRKLGDALGLDLISDPDQLLDPTTAARALAFFFKSHGVDIQANAQNWRGVRVRVNGGVNGLDRFLGYVNSLVESLNG